MALSTPPVPQGGEVPPSPGVRIPVRTVDQHGLTGAFLGAPLLPLPLSDARGVEGGGSVPSGVRPTGTPKLRPCFQAGLPFGTDMAQ